MSYDASFKTFPVARFAYNEYDRIGSGSNGVVARAVDTKDGRVVALKFQARDTRPGAPVLRQQRKEHIIHAALSDHPSVVTLIDTYVTADHVVSAMHLCRGGDLFTAVFHDAFRLRVDELRDGFLQLTSALSYMHANGLYHRDLKLENVLLSPDLRTWKICDFGWASDQEITEQPGLGSTFYRAPEILRGHYYNRDADIYALGMVMFVAVAQSKPWLRPHRKDVDFRLYLTHGVAHLQTVANISDAFGELCSRFLTADPLDRITLVEAGQELEALNPIMLRCLPADFFDGPRVPPRPTRHVTRNAEKQQTQTPQPATVPSLVRTTSGDTWSASSVGQPATPPPTPPSGSPTPREEKINVIPAQPMLSSGFPAVSYSHTPFSIAPTEPIRQKMGIRERLGASLRRAVRSLQSKKASTYASSPFDPTTTVGR